MRRQKESWWYLTKAFDASEGRDPRCRCLLLRYPAEIVHLAQGRQTEDVVLWSHSPLAYEKWRRPPSAAPTNMRCGSPSMVRIKTSTQAIATCSCSRMALFFR